MDQPNRFKELLLINPASNCQEEVFWPVEVFMVVPYLDMEVDMILSSLFLSFDDLCFHAYQGFD